MSATCDARQGCPNPIAYVTNRGYLTCEQHRGPQRDAYYSRRKLRPAERRFILSGRPLSDYRASR